MKVIKRDGSEVDFDRNKINVAIYKAILASHSQEELKERFSQSVLEDITDQVVAKCIDTVDTSYAILKKLNKINPNVPDTELSITITAIQDIVEKTLIQNGYADTAKAYILYRAKRDEIRNSRDSINKAISDVLMSDSKDSDTKRENGNINGDTPMGTMLQIASSVSKNYYLNNMMSKDIAKAETDGYIHIHDLDFYKLTVTCVQMDCEKLFKGGFNTGKGQIREPNSITSYTSLAAVAIQAEQNFQHGGISIPNFDFAMAPGIYKSFRKAWKTNINKAIEFGLLNKDDFTLVIENNPNTTSITDKDDYKYVRISNIFDDDEQLIESVLTDKKDYQYFNKEKTGDCLDEQIYKIIDMTKKDVERECYQAMEAFVHNLNTMHSRGGGQVAFSSINLGCALSEAGRMITKNLLLNIEAGLGNGETSIFPIVIFLVKEGFNYNPEDKNHDLLQLAYRVTGKRLYPNFCLEDSSFNAQYYKEGHPETLVQTMGE